MFLKFFYVLACIRTHSFLLPNQIPLHGSATFYLPFYLVMDIWVVSAFWFLWILLWTFRYNFFTNIRISFSWVYTWQGNRWVTWSSERVQICCIWTRAQYCLLLVMVCDSTQRVLLVREAHLSFLGEVNSSLKITVKMNNKEANFKNQRK